jgi:transposase
MILLAMNKTFRSWDVDQDWLIPQSLHEFVTADHVAHFVRDLVRDELDLTPILSSYDEERGSPPYHPGMMVAILLYAYTQGVYSSRRIARCCEERLDFMAVTAMNRPDFRTISDFRKRHLSALADLFLQVLLLCRAAGLVQLGHVAIDGTKLKANASRHKAMSYARMRQAEANLAAQVAGWLEMADRNDAAEDAEYGSQRGDQMPAWVRTKRQRLERIRAAKAALEAEAKQEPSAADPDGPGPSSGMQAYGRPNRSADGGPPDRAQRNFTDPDSRILPTRDGFIAGYNGQLAVDAANQIILSHRLVTNSADVDGLIPLVDAAYAALGRKPAEISADNGFASETNLEALADRRIRAYMACRRGRHRDEPETTWRRLKKQPRMMAMAATIKRAGRRSRYRLRKQTVEPVIGQIKQARGFRQFLLRGFNRVRAEWALICTAHNLLKLAGHR